MNKHTKIVVILVVVLCVISAAACFINMYGRIKQEDYVGDPGTQSVKQHHDLGDPLILTPYIEQGKIEEAQNLAEVQFSEFRNVRSYSGYFTVDKVYDSNLFFWFFPSKTDYKNAPVILWLQGGPGASSLSGLFLENGPFMLSQKGEIMSRKYPWTERHSVIYIDNPVDVGFSFTSGGNARNQTIIGESLYKALFQFFQMFPELQKNDFFIAGESYAGKYVPAAGYAIHMNNPSAEVKINLKGLAIGNGLIDPLHQKVGYADYLYQLGFIDSNTKLFMQNLEVHTVEHIKNERWLEAFQQFDDELTLVEVRAGIKNFYNYLMPEHYIEGSLGIIQDYLRRSDVKKALHVGNVNFVVESDTARSQLMEDRMKSVAPWFSTLLDHYRVLIYNGQLDIIEAYPLTINFLENLHFSAENEYKSATRRQWYVGGKLAGYVKEAGNLTEVLVRNAGHLVPMDQPLWAFDLINRFTHKMPLYQKTKR